MVGNC